MFLMFAGKAKNSNSASKYSKFNVAQDSLAAIPENILFIEDLCEILSELFPNLWKLGQSYFTGELHVKVEPGRQSGFKVYFVLIITFMGIRT